jgi:hypothetical protein
MRELARAGERFEVARSPANTRGTFSLQIGITIAVRASRAITPAAAVREIA